MTPGDSSGYKYHINSRLNISFGIWASRGVISYRLMHIVLCNLTPDMSFKLMLRPESSKSC